MRIRNARAVKVLLRQCNEGGPSGGFEDFPSALFKLRPVDVERCQPGTGGFVSPEVSPQGLCSNHRVDGTAAGT